MAEHATLVKLLARELSVHLPFSEMKSHDVQAFVAASQERYFASDEVVIAPAQGAAQWLYWIRRGSVHGADGLSQITTGRFEYEAGDLFPISAILAGSAVSTEYRAYGDTFVLQVPRDFALQLAEQSAAFADFMNRRVARFLEHSRAALRQVYAERSLAEQSYERPLGSLPVRKLQVCAPDTSLQQVLLQMFEQRVGSVIAVDNHKPVGILTRYDVLGKITLPQLALSSPIKAVMSTPLICADTNLSVQNAALLMSRHGIRHLPVVNDQGLLVNLVSERDLFSLQRLTLKSVGTAIRAAQDIDALILAAAQIRDLARSLVSQGVQARQLTGLISHLNDLLTARLVNIAAREHQIQSTAFCWLSFGSEGRSEQTIATDQDNGLVFDSDEITEQQALAFAQFVNTALDQCGYPLCKGKIMASNPQWCLPQSQWLEVFRQWIRQASPENTLNAAIFFDLRVLAGQVSLAKPLRDVIEQEVKQAPLFLRLLAQNGLRFEPALTLWGGLDTQTKQGSTGLDLKLHGTAIVVDAARTLCLANGIAATNTRERLEALASIKVINAEESASSIAAFEVLQMLRLRVQLEPEAQALKGNPNWIEPASLNEIDRKMLKEAMRMARDLQQKMALAYRLG
jgi:CBS domain-containing protein